MGWREVSVEAEGMEGVEEWEPCSRMGAVQGAGGGLGGTSAQVTHRFPVSPTAWGCHHCDLGAKQLKDIGGIGRAARCGTITTQERPLPCLRPTMVRLQLCQGSPQPPSCDLPWEGGACSPSRIHPQSSIPHPHLPQLPPMRTLQSSLQEAKSCIRCESYPLQSFMLCCNMAKCAPGVLQAFAWECQRFLLVCYTTCYVGHQQRAKELLHLPCLCVPELSLGLLEVC